VTNQNLSFVSALTGSLLGFGPLVCDKACRTSGLAEISSAVSTVAISLDSRRASDLIVARNEKLGHPLPVAQASCPPPGESAHLAEKSSSQLRTLAATTFTRSSLLFSRRATVSDDCVV
jgi:hypothetical protein